MSTHRVPINDGEDLTAQLYETTDGNFILKITDGGGKVIKSIHGSRSFVLFNFERMFPDVGLRDQTASEKLVVGKSVGKCRFYVVNQKFCLTKSVVVECNGIDHRCEACPVC